MVSTNESSELWRTHKCRRIKVSFLGNLDKIVKMIPSVVGSGHHHLLEKHFTGRVEFESRFQPSGADSQPFLQVIILTHGTVGEP